MTRPAAHWDAAYAKGAEAVTWYDPRASETLDLVRPLIGPGDAVLDVGGGASDLAARLVAEGLGPVDVLDVSGAALTLARDRAGAAGARIGWIAADVTAWTPPRAYALWHDRAVFHFLTDPADRAAYLAAMTAGVAPGGHAVLSTFAEDGPERCSGLPVVRYAPEALAAAIEAAVPGAFRFVSAARHVHRTPAGGGQRFQTSVFERLP